MKITFSAHALPESGTAVATVLDGRTLSPSAASLDEQTGGALSRAMEASSFRGGRDQTFVVRVPAGTELASVVLIGLGKAEDLTSRSVQGAGGRVYAAVAADPVEAVTILVDPIDGFDMTPAEIAANMAVGARLRAYRFDKYRTKEKAEDKPRIKTLTLACAGHKAAGNAYDPLAKVADGVMFTRDLVSEPPNVLYPETLAKASKELEALGLEVEILGEKEMKKLGMNLLLGVGQGSARESQLVVMQWNGAGKSKGGKGKKKPGTGPVAFVGKGVTFDTGGISIKPSAGMEEMKYDMGGAGAVVGVMKALAGRKAKVDAVGVIGCVENMPSGKAQRPGDIVTSMSGQTVEILNTDAEGRLVLGDALWYAQERFKPRFMIDLATLTGAIVIALGNHKAGLFSNDDDLAERIDAAGEAVGEAVWRMPLGPEYDKALKSDAADMKNIGNRMAGSTTAAQFLQRFVNDVPWAHLDVAGVAWTKEPLDIVPKGASGYGVRLLDRLVQDYYEND